MFVPTALIVFPEGAILPQRKLQLLYHIQYDLSLIHI